MEQGRAKQANVDGSPYRVAVVVASFNDNVTGLLLEGALSELRQLGVKDENVVTIRVPGAFEIPVAMKRLLASKRFQAGVALGAVIRGETAHFDYVCQGSLQGIMQISCELGIPIGNGILTCDTLQQAMDRAGGRVGNLGAAAARAALETESALRKADCL